MENLISKELLSEVFKRNIIDIKTSLDDYSINDNILEYGDDLSPIYFEINIYELAHKCKEWAFDLGYEISSSKRVEENNKWIAVCWKGFAEAKPMEIENTEPKAILKACQWILDNEVKYER